MGVSKYIGRAKSMRNKRTELERQFVRVYISGKDFEQCVEYAAFAEAATEETVRRGLITASIISYARPFSANESHEKAIPKPPVSVDKHLTSEELLLHNRLCNIRNQAVAHSDFGMNPARLVEVIGRGHLVSSRLYDPMVEFSNIGKIRALADKMKKAMLNKEFELSRLISEIPI